MSDKPIPADGHRLICYVGDGLGQRPVTVLPNRNGDITWSTFDRVRQVPEPEATSLLRDQPGNFKEATVLTGTPGKTAYVQTYTTPDGTAVDVRVAGVVVVEPAPEMTSTTPAKGAKE